MTPQICQLSLTKSMTLPQFCGSSSFRFLVFVGGFVEDKDRKKQALKKQLSVEDFTLFLFV